MNSKPTYDDANLILRLYEMRREPRMRQARSWFVANFKGITTYTEFLALAPGGSDENASFRQVTSYWDLVASFITGGVLNKTLFFQSSRECLLVWERIRDFLPSMREAYADPKFLGHLETVGTDYAAYMQTTNPGAYEAMLKRVK